MPLFERESLLFSRKQVRVNESSLFVRTSLQEGKWGALAGGIAGGILGGGLPGGAIGAALGDRAGEKVGNWWQGVKQKAYGNQPQVAQPQQTRNQPQQPQVAQPFNRQAAKYKEAQDALGWSKYNFLNTGAGSAWDQSNKLRNQFVADQVGAFDRSKAARQEKADIHAQNMSNIGLNRDIAWNQAERRTTRDTAKAAREQSRAGLNADKGHNLYNTASRKAYWQQAKAQRLNNKEGFAAIFGAADALRKNKEVDNQRLINLRKLRNSSEAAKLQSRTAARQSSVARAVARSPEAVAKEKTTRLKDRLAALRNTISNPSAISKAEFGKNLRVEPRVKRKVKTKSPVTQSAPPNPAPPTKAVTPTGSSP